MASELLKNRALIQRLKEPKLPTVDFSLSTASFESTLPEPKPQELLDIQENVRIQRQQDTMNKARPFLMDESVDFIERQDKAIGGGLFSGTDLGTREGFAGIRYNLQSLGGEGNEYIKTFETKLKNLGFKKGKPDKDGFTLFTLSPADLAKMVDKKNKKKRAQ